MQAIKIYFLLVPFVHQVSFYSSPNVNVVFLIPKKWITKNKRWSLLVETWNNLIRNYRKNRRALINWFAYTKGLNFVFCTVFRYSQKNFNMSRKRFCWHVHLFGVNFFPPFILNMFAKICWCYRLISLHITQCGCVPGAIKFRYAQHNRQKWNRKRSQIPHLYHIFDLVT